MGYLIVSGALSIIGAIVALLCSHREMAAKVVGCLFGIASTITAIICGFVAILGTPEIVTFLSWFDFAPFSLRLNPLDGLILLVINVLGLMGFIYGLTYFDDYKGKGIGAIGFFLNLFMMSMNFVITVDNAFWLLVFFEMMSLTSYFLVTIAQNEQSRHGGYMYFVMAHVGFFLIMVAFFIMAAVTGSFDFEAYRRTDFGPVLSSLIFLLGFFGFGCKAGMFPVHSWLPQAHPEAPSNVSSLMSGGMVKIGIFGMLLITLDLLQSCTVEVWWGIVVLLIGAASSVLGVAYALGEHDVKKLLAYHTVENIGIILLGIGTSITGIGLQNPAVAGLGMMAGLFHLINHAMFKGLLFLGAGSVLFATGTRNMDVLGGLIRKMPITAGCFLVGSLAITAIPPLNGFFSEWATYQAMFTAAGDTNWWVMIFMGFAILSLAITGALALTCFAKAYGITFLGSARSDLVEKAKEVEFPMTLPMIILSIICVLLGVCAPWVEPFVMGIASSVSGVYGNIAAAGVVINPNFDTAISPLLVFILLVVMILLAYGLRACFRKGGIAHDRDPWACGYQPDEQMPVEAFSFTAEVRMFFTPLYAGRDAIVALVAKWKRFFHGVQHAADKAQNWGDFAVWEPFKSVSTWLGHLAQRIESGNSRYYVAYIVAGLVAFLIIAVAL